MELLSVEHISKQINDTPLIKDISFKQNEFQKIVIAGESGAGKSTLLKIISGHAQLDSGVVMFNGKRVIGPEDKLLAGHKEIGYLSQHYELLNNYVVRDLIWFQIKIEEDAVSDLFEICRISHLLQRRTDQLSGGEKQRIALCRLLIKAPKMLLLDEPFSNLDPIHTNILKAVLEDITRRLQITCLLTSHDPHDTLSWADEIIVMKEGAIIQKGAPETIYQQPMNEYVAGMFGKYNLLNPKQAALFGIETNEKDVMIRPENFSVGSAVSDSVIGTIKKLSFWGSFYETEVLIEDVVIIVHLMKPDFFEGDRVFVRINN